jgi:hypothetical protein
MADVEIREEGSAEQAPPEAPVEQVGAEAPTDEAPADAAAPRVGAPLCEERLVEVRFVRDTNWCVATAEDSFIEPLAAGEQRTLPWETAQVFIGQGAAVWAGDEELAVKATAGEVATRSRRRRK